MAPIVNKLAAGNLFCGEFAGLDGMNGKVNFGRPFTGRPTALRFWVKYQGGQVDYEGGPEGSKITTNDFDKGQIKFALGTWDKNKFGGTETCPVQVNTSNEKTFWPINSIEGTIAYADIVLQGDGSEIYHHLGCGKHVRRLLRRQFFEPAVARRHGTHI